MKYIFYFLLLTSGLPQEGPIKIDRINIGVDGLHCSACSYSVEKSLYKVKGIQSIQMDLNTKIGTIDLIDDSVIDLYGLVQAVKNAGFSVRYVDLVLETKIDQNYSCCVDISNAKQGLIITDLSQDKSTFRLQAKAFLPKKDFKRVQDHSCACMQAAIPAK